ncbi:MAG TPA: hypothetical protein VGG10_22630 [Rhizomicrobium sp.]|jgi:hypothetical protein
MKALGIAIFALTTLALCCPAIAVDIRIPPGGQWAQFVVDHLDLRNFPSSLGNRRNEGKITFADFGIRLRSVSARKALLGTDWDYTISVLSHTREKILICFTDHAANGGSYDAQKPLALTMTADGHLLGKEVLTPRADCSRFSR